ncbi:MAG: hypothetical protein NW241_22775 [Bacteroidia bacterium]|nr:hypothetical protein [Bacteroidia bacterium]
MDVVANQQNLKGGFKRHGDIAKSGSDSTHYLLYFYANECGLKYLFLRENRLQNTGRFAAHSGLSGQKYGHGHDLLKWVGELKIPNFTYKDETGHPVPLRQAHEALRYGQGIHEDQKKVLKSLFITLATKIQ